MSRVDYTDLVVECAGLKEQVLEVMIESDQCKQSHKALRQAMKSYQQRLKQAADQRAFLYREYSKYSQEWLEEKKNFTEKVTL